MEIRGATTARGGTHLASRKLLRPAFRMAILNGAVESVQLHLSAMGNANAIDEKGRSPLILAASKGRVDVCRLLLAEGANPTLRDNEGNDARAVALASGHVEVARLLSDCYLPAEQTQRGQADHDGVRNLGQAQPSDPYPDHVDNSKTASRRWVATRSQDFLEKRDAFPSSQIYVEGQLPKSYEWRDSEEPLDLSDWEELSEGPPPPNDLSSATEAGALQARLSAHTPIDTDIDWEDVAVDLPDLGDLLRHYIPLSPQEEQSLRTLVLEALKDRRTSYERIASALSAGGEDDSSTRRDLEACVRLALGDLGVMVEEDPFASDTFIHPDEDEGKFGEEASEALGFLGHLWTNRSDPLALYTGELGGDLLTREDERALGRAVETGKFEVLTGLVKSAAARSRLLEDVNNVFAGKTLVDSLFVGRRGGENYDKQATSPEPQDEANQVDGEFTPEEGNSLLPEHLSKPLEMIKESCQRIEPDVTRLAENLWEVEPEPEYVMNLRRIAEHDPQFGEASDKIASGLEKADAAKRRLVEANLRLVIWVARKHGGLTLMDRIQEGNIGLMKAAERFDFRRGTKFSTFAVWWVRQAIGRAVADQARIVRLPVHVQENLRKIQRAQGETSPGYEENLDIIALLTGFSLDQVKRLLNVADEPISMEEQPDKILSLVDCTASTPEEILATSEVPVLVRSYLDCLDDREKDIICRRFGIDGDEQTLEEIGRVYSVSRERIRQIESKALEKLAHPSRINQLRDLQ